MKRRYTLAFLLLCILPVLCPAQRTEIPAGVNPSSDSLHRTVAPNPPSDPDSLRLSRIDSELATLVGRDSTFRREVDVTSGRLSLSELLRNIARASGVNVSVRSVENIPVSCNFRRARVDDLVRFLCREYRLDVAASGNILRSFRRQRRRPGARSRRRLRGRRHDAHVRPARRTSDRRGEEDRTSLCAQRHRPRTFVRLQGLGLRASYAFRRRAADARCGQRSACRTGCAGRVDAVARGAGRAGRQGVRRPRLYAPAAVHAQRTACGLAGAHHGPHRAGQRAGRDSRPVRRVGAELLLPVAGEPHGGRLGGRDGFRDAALGAAQRLAVQLLHRTGHLDLRSGRVGRSLVGDGTSARLPLRVEGRGDHPRGAETERRGEDLPPI